MQASSLQLGEAYGYGDFKKRRRYCSLKTTNAKNARQMLTLEILCYLKTCSTGMASIISFAVGVISALQCSIIDSNFASYTTLWNNGFVVYLKQYCLGQAKHYLHSENFNDRCYITHQVRSSNVSYSGFMDLWICDWARLAKGLSLCRIFE